MIVPCECGAKLKIDDAKIPEKGVKVRCPRCGSVLYAQKPVAALPVAAPVAMPAVPFPLKEKEITQSASFSDALVLIAHDSGVVRTMVSTMLTDAGFRVDTAADGVEALKKATESRPQGMVLDVGLPGIYGFELCERLKGNPDTGAIKIVLVSSIYDMRRYKRTPVNLYGADDYVEKHHIHDLPAKLRLLIYPEKYEAAPPELKASYQQDLPEMSRPPEREFEPSLLSSDNLSPIGQEIPEFAQAREDGAATVPADHTISPESFSLEASILQKEEFHIPKVDEADPDAVEKAKRFARIIVSDIALYNQQAVIEGIQNGSFYEVLKNDIQEGRELYEKRVPAVIRDRKDYFKEAFDNFISAAQRKAGRA
jgi:predicted Zn finger-like uncharacterized protein